MNSLLFSSVTVGNVELAKEILKSDPNLDVNWSDSPGWAVLQRASKNGHEGIVAILLAHPDIDVNQRDKYGGATPFIVACRNGRTSCVRLLLQDSRVRVNQPNDSGYTALWQCGFLGHLDIVEWWIASGREMDLGKPEEERTNAMVGATTVREWHNEVDQEKKRKIVTLLTRFKKNPEETRSAVRSELGIVGEVAAPTAPELTKDEYLAFLNSLPTHPSLRYFAVQDGNVERAKRILRENFALDPNWRHPDSDSTALHHACQHSLEPLVSILLAHPGIDVNSKDRDGQTPFNSASANRSISCLRLLLKDLRVNLGEPDNSGGTPLNAVLCYSVVAFKWWIASGREVDLGNAIGKATGETTMSILLKRFENNPTQTRHEIRKELGINGQFFIGQHIAGI